MRGGLSADDCARMMRALNVCCTLTKTLVKAGIIKERTRTSFVRWVDLNEIAAKGDRMVGDDVAEAGIESLKAINATNRRIVRRICA